MSTDKIPFSKKKKESHPKLSQIRSYRIFPRGLKNEFETAVVNEPSVFEPLKFYCIYFPRVPYSVFAFRGNLYHQIVLS